MSALFEPLRLGRITHRNRVIKTVVARMRLSIRT